MLKIFPKKKKTKQLYVVAAGSPFNGLNLFGPFKSFKKAVKAANKGLDDTWWVLPITKWDIED